MDKLIKHKSTLRNQVIKWIRGLIQETEGGGVVSGRTGNYEWIAYDALDDNFELERNHPVARTKESGASQYTQVLEERRQRHPVSTTLPGGDALPA